MMKQSNCRRKKIFLVRFLLTGILYFGGYFYSTSQNQKIQVIGTDNSFSDQLTLPGGSSIDLTTQLSGVMLIEAAAKLDKAGIFD